MDIYIKKAMEIKTLSYNQIQIDCMGKIILLEFEHRKIKKNFLDMLPLFDGKNTMDEIQGKSSFEKDVFAVMVNTLHSHNLLEKAGKQFREDPPAEYVEAFGNIFTLFDDSVGLFSKAERINRIYNFTVSVIGINELSAEIVLRLLEFGFRNINVISFGHNEKTEEYLKNARTYKDADLKFTAITEPEDLIPIDLGDFAIVGSIERANDYYENINEICVTKEQKWIPVYYNDTLGLIGPAIVPGQTACFKCMDIRYVSNVENIEAYKAFLEYEKQGNKSSVMYLRNDIQLIANNFIFEFFKLAASCPYPATYNHVIEISCVENKIGSLSVYRFPICPACAEKKHKLPYENEEYKELFDNLKQYVH